ncbi:hypothetical protein [Streptomyces sp. NPDC020965]|uniref:hypothetical protein n=1 Tax=Streptomyces sp. NPDC020965 TaxID=3365105 RepID=UPI00378E598B
MNGSVEEWPAYHCDVIAEGPVYGTGERRAVVLGTCRTISPKLALRWLCAQARRIADRLDPDPEVCSWARPVTGPDRGSGPDGPTGLRRWADDIEGDRAARDQLTGGAPLTLTVDDGPNGVFRLAIWPVTVRPVPEPEISAAASLLTSVELPPCALLPMRRSATRCEKGESHRLRLCRDGSRSACPPRAGDPRQGRAEPRPPEVQSSGAGRRSTTPNRKV